MSYQLPNPEQLRKLHKDPSPARAEWWRKALSRTAKDSNLSIANLLGKTDKHPESILDISVSSIRSWVKQTRGIPIQRAQAVVDCFNENGYVSIVETIVNEGYIDPDSRISNRVNSSVKTTVSGNAKSVNAVSIDDVTMSKSSALSVFNVIDNLTIDESVDDTDYARLRLRLIMIVGPSVIYKSKIDKLEREISELTDRLIAHTRATYSPGKTNDELMQHVMNGATLNAKLTDAQSELDKILNGSRTDASDADASDADAKVEVSIE